MPPKMTANPTRPARYRAGKPIGVDSGSSSESETDNEVSTKAQQQPKAAAPSAPRRTGAGRVIAPGALAQALSEPKNDEDEKRKAREAIERKAAEEGFVTESEEEEESDSEEEDDDDDDDDDDDEGSSSEDDMPTRNITLPKFMTRAQRERAAKGQDSGGRDTGSTKKKDELEKVEEEEEDAKENEAKERQAQVDALVEEQLRKQAASRVISKKQWEDSNELAAAAAAAGEGEEVAGDVNTDDDVDPEAEYAAWKLRELKRIKRQREQIEERERELTEIERRRNLTEEERQAEDEAHLAKQKEEKDSRGQAGFMQKYYHKGAFYQEETKAEGLDKRDLMGAHYVDEIRNREMLPKSLQMRDMTKLGRKGASKYRDLRSEDTGRWGVLDDNRNQQRNGGWDRGRDHDRDRLGYAGAGDHDGGGGGSEHDAKGANAMPLGERRKHIDRDRRQSRSRSPRRERDRRREGNDRGYERRKRSPSGDEHNGDKRRRVEA